MPTRAYLSALLTALFLAGCGSGKKAPAQPAPEAVVHNEAEGPAVSMCRSICAKIGDRCVDDPTASFQADACTDACADETDSVIEDARACAERATSCAEALACREPLGD